MPARVRPGGQLPEQAGLADPRFAHQLDRCRHPLVELCEEMVDRAEFRSAANEVLGECHLSLPARTIDQGRTIEKSGCELRVAARCRGRGVAAGSKHALFPPRTPTRAARVRRRVRRLSRLREPASPQGDARVMPFRRPLDLVDGGSNKRRERARAAALLRRRAHDGNAGQRGPDLVKPLGRHPREGGVVNESHPHAIWNERAVRENGLMTIDPVQYARRWKTLGVLSLSLVIIGLDNTILNVALPTLQHEFNASPSKLQWMVDSYLLVFAGLLLVFGVLGDRFGRKRALQAGISIFGLASLGALLADSADQVIAVRAAMGVGAALIMPATLSIIANLFTGKERGKAIAIWAALAAVGIGLGPLSGGLLLEWFDWSSVFMVNVPFAALALLLGIRYVPESRDPRPGSFDLPGAALSTAGFSLLVYAIIEAPGHGWTSELILGLLVASVLLIGTFLWWERRIDEPMLDLGFFRSRGFSVGTAAVSVAFFGLLGGIFALTQYLQFVHGYSAIEAGAIMSPLALGLMKGAGSSSKTPQRPRGSPGRPRRLS